MEVYLVEQDDMKRVSESELDKEAKLEQRLVRTEGAKIGDVEVLYVGRQGSPGEGGIFDILGVDERGDTVVVELKRGRAPRDVVAQALEYAGEIRNVEYEYLNERYREFLREEQGYADPTDILSLREAHADYFDLDDTLSEREFNDEQRLIVVGTEFRDVSLNMADFLREHGIDVVAVEYSSYYDDEEGIELLTTDGVRRPLSEEPTSSKTPTSDKEEYGDLIVSVRDQVFPDIHEQLQIEDPEELATRTNTRQMSFRSGAPDHPHPLKYGVKPLIADKGIVRLGVHMSKSNVDNEKRETLRGFLESHVGALDGYVLNDDPSAAMFVLSKEVDVSEEVDSKEIAQELGDLVDTLHPKAVDEYADHEAF